MPDSITVHVFDENCAEHAASEPAVKARTNEVRPMLQTLARTLMCAQELRPLC